MREVREFAYNLGEIILSVPKWHRETTKQQTKWTDRKFVWCQWIRLLSHWTPILQNAVEDSLHLVYIYTSYQYRLHYSTNKKSGHPC